ncbi:transient receptor potential cation channel subfamily A member 1-like [Penaeus japonicus]|uniref:transient receptor potential cation channel subfamily A member 1-like n=1 Tax=Penaeus japonicus TaxID=27405 RepID=UPI001C714409|nr:transient receptor potential cation channel subfamily A member 1-like [Penaeus japonicus]
MASLPTSFIRSIVAWKRPTRRNIKNEDVNGSPRSRCAFLQEPSQAGQDDTNVFSSPKVSPNDQLCLMAESPFRMLKMAAKGNVTEMERIYDTDPERMCIADSKGWTSLHHAAANNQISALQFLINHGADLNAQDKQGRTPLHVAAEKEALQAVDSLLDCGADSSITDHQGDTVLHWVTNLNKVTVLQRLLTHEHKVNILQGDRQGRTALHIAAKHDYELCAKYILESVSYVGTCPNQPCSNGYHPIHIAARNASTKVLEVLLTWAETRGCMRKKMITVPDLEGNVPLHQAVHGGEIKAVELCLKSGAIISTQQDDRSTPVHLACSQGANEIVRLMFSLQPDEKLKALTTLDAQGMTPLHCAAMFDHPDLVAYLIQEGASVDQVDQEHRSPLLLAASRRGWRTVDALLAHGADPTIRDTHLKNLLHVVIMNGGSISDVLSLKQARDTLSTSRITMMLNEQDSLGWSPLHYASRNGHVYGRYNTVRQLVESKSGFLILNECNDEGKTALHIASEEGHTRVVQLLLSKGALLHRDHHGRTPLHLAALGGHRDTITTILTIHSHTLDQTDKEGNTALHVAVRANKPETVSQLMSLNCKFLENNSSCKPIDIAIQYKISESALALVTHERGPTEVLGTSSKIHGCICMALIRTLPKVFESVLCQAIVKADVKEQAKDFYIKYNFYPLQLTPEQLDAEKIKQKNPNFRPEPLYACNAMVESGRVELLMHPLTQKFLEMKWQAYGKYIHLSNLFVYLVFLTLVTIFAVGVLGQQSFVRLNVTGITADNDSDLTTTGQFQLHIEDTPGWMFCMAIGITVFATFSMIKEAFQIYYHRIKYLAEPINFVEWTMFLTSICMVMPVFLGTTWHNQQYNSAALAVFCAWFILLIYFQRFDRIGIYIVMFLEILNTLLNVLLVFSVLIVAFGLAFYILMSHGGQLSFSNVPMSMLHTFSMMLGEVDFLTIFVYPFYQESTRGDILLFPRTTFALLVIFMILMPILLMNLLIGLAVGDIESVRKNAQLKRIAMQVEMHTELENKLPEMFIRRVNKSELTIYPNCRRGQHVLNRVLSAFNFACPFSDKKGTDLDTTDCSSDDYLWEELEGQRRRLRDISAVLDTQTKLLRLIMQKMEIRSEADDVDEGVNLEDIMKPFPNRKFAPASATSRRAILYRKE